MMMFSFSICILTLDLVVRMVMSDDFGYDVGHFVRFCKGMQVPMLSMTITLC